MAPDWTNAGCKGCQPLVFIDPCTACLAFCLRREHGPCIDRLSIEQNGVRAGESLLIAEFDSVIAESANCGQHRFGSRAINLMFFCVDNECKFHVRSFSLKGR